MKISAIRDELDQLEHIAPLEGEQYASSLAIYEAASNQRARILDWIQTSLLPRFNTPRLSILSIGCGAGELDREILASSAARVPAVNYTGLEPDGRQCARFLRFMRQDQGPNVHIEAHNLSFENFLDPRRFDLVFMVHSLYYMEDPGRAIDKALKLVKPGGLLVTMVAPNDTLNELSSSFWNKEQDRTAWFSEDVEHYLRDSAVAFDRHRLEARLDMTDCFQPDSERGQNILDFLAQAPTTELPIHVQDMIFEYVDAKCHRDGPTRWLPHNVDAFVIAA